MKHYNILQSKSQNMDKLLDDTMKNYQHNLEITKKPETDSLTNKSKTQTDVPELTTNTAAENGENDKSDLELKKEDSANTGMHDTDVETVIDTLNAKTDKDLLHETTNGQLSTTRNDTKQRAVRSVTDPVAFHVVHTQPTTQYPQIHDAVKFGDVLLNEGNSYHNHYGSFIAPQPGFCLFSTSIMCKTPSAFVEAQVSIVKNGHRLARAYCQANKSIQDMQSSVTVVTRLNSADEVWVEFDWPNGGYIWGNGFGLCCFTGPIL